MIFEKKLIPDFYFDNIYCMDANFFKSNNIKGIVADIDNTLVTYDDPEPTPRLREWFNMLADAGVKISFVSNNEKKRVEIFNKSLGFFAVGKAGKPSPVNIKSAMKHMGTDESNSIMLGDQLLTDAWAGKAANIRTVIVFPIKDKTSLFFRAKRKLEVPYIKKYRKIHNI